MSDHPKSSTNDAEDHDRVANHLYLELIAEKDRRIEDKDRQIAEKDSRIAELTASLERQRRVGGVET